MQNLILNAGFEDISAQYCSNTTCILNNTMAIYPWTTNHTFELLDYPLFAYEGKYALSLNTDSPYTISQAVSLQPLQQYQLTFMVTSQEACTGYIGVGNELVFFNCNKEFANWKRVYYTFIASDVKSTINIGSTTNGSSGPIIDNIILAPLLSTNSTSNLDVCLSGWLIYYIWATSKWEERVNREVEMEDMVDDCATLNEEPIIVQVGGE
ncbi:hypothetical protein HDV04_005893 [Boothiomyces sp. JEL0838]|nr:hypothetical protein HDV04_005893 [Boothiomyces sp. JEL0838]